jgi:hypothetical protein
MEYKLVQCLSALHVAQYLKSSLVQHLKVTVNHLRQELKTVLDGFDLFDDDLDNLQRVGHLMYLLDDERLFD